MFGHITDKQNGRQTSTKTQITDRINTIDSNFCCINIGINTTVKHTLCYMVFLLAAQTDNVAGVLRGIRDMENPPYHLEPIREIK